MPKRFSRSALRSSPQSAVDFSAVNVDRINEAIIGSLVVALILTIKPFVVAMIVGLVVVAVLKVAPLLGRRVLGERRRLETPSTPADLSGTLRGISGVTGDLSISVGESIRVRG